MYDETGAPIGIQYRQNSDAAEVFSTYVFEKNLQGDIIAIYNESGTKIATYTYDAWGNFTLTYASGISATDRVAATNNPFTYRGYYFDSETDLYYLNSRYYNSAWGRFICADEYISTGQDIFGCNMFSYCGNNPISRSDDDGDVWGFAIGAIVSAATDFTMQLIFNGGQLSEVDWGSVGMSALTGAISGLAGDVVSGAAKSITKNVVKQTAIKAIGSGLTNVGIDYFTGDINNVAGAIDSFSQGVVSEVAADVLAGISSSIRKSNFDNMGRSAQKHTLTHQVFKDGNYFNHWTWSSYRSTNQFDEYINKYLDALGIINGIFWDFVTYEN